MYHTVKSILKNISMQRFTKELLEVMEMFYILIVVVNRCVIFQHSTNDKYTLNGCILSYIDNTSEGQLFKN